MIGPAPPAGPVDGLIPPDSPRRLRFFDQHRYEPVTVSARRSLVTHPQVSSRPPSTRADDRGGLFQRSIDLGRNRIRLRCACPPDGVTTTRQRARRFRCCAVIFPRVVEKTLASASLRKLATVVRNAALSRPRAPRVPQLGFGKRLLRVKSEVGQASVMGGERTLQGCHAGPGGTGSLSRLAESMAEQTPTRAHASR